jgi:hypothetical protein
VQRPGQGLNVIGAALWAIVPVDDSTLALLY